MKYIEFIEHITSDIITKEEMNDFNLRVINDPVLRNEYEEYNQSISILNEQATILKKTISKTIDFKFRINEAFESLPTDTGTDDERIRKLSDLIRSTINRGRSNGHTRFNRWFKAAAIFIVIIISSIPASKSIENSPVFLNIRKFNLPMYIPIVTREKDNNPNSIQVAWSLYSNKNIDSALMVLDSFSYSPEQEADRVIFRSVCLMERKEYKEALQALDMLSDDCLYHVTSLWYRAICYINLHKEDEAIIHLEEIARIDRNYRKSVRKIEYLLNTNALLELDFSPSKYFQDGTYRYK